MADKGFVVYAAIVLPGDPMPPGLYRKAWALNESYGKDALNIEYVCTPEQQQQWVTARGDARKGSDAP